MSNFEEHLEEEVKPVLALIKAKLPLSRHGTCTWALERECL